MKKSFQILFWGILIIAAATSCNTKEYTVTADSFSIVINENMMTRQVNNNDKEEIINADFSASEFLETNYGIISDFRLTGGEVFEENTENGLISQHVIKGVHKSDMVNIEKVLLFTTYENHPDLVSLKVKYINHGDAGVRVLGWTNHENTFYTADTLLWSFQGATYSERPDWILPVTPGYYRENFMGMNSTDYGGGIPVVDLWRKDMGIAIGLLETKPVMASLPVEMKENIKGASAKISCDTEFQLLPEKSFETFETFIIKHSGDCFSSLETFTSVMQERGITFPESEPAAFESVWCAWGYERDFSVEEVLGTLPKVKELGIKWAVLDDGFQITEGDWTVNKQKFPGGEKQMKHLVDEIHRHGLKAKLWYAPLAIDLKSDLYESDPDLLLINKQQSPEYITWWDCFMMAPHYSGTITHTVETVEMFMNEWGFDGLKLDGQHLNGVPCDHSWTRPSEHPTQSVESLPIFFDTLYNTARSIKPDAVVEICPCGCCCNYFIMPHMNQAVSSDPTSSWQIRLKGKVYRALMPNTAYYGDHVELSDEAADFESTFGIGAVPGTKFTYPKNNPTASGDFLLTPEKEKTWKFWFNLYDDMRLSQGEYIGDLYDIGYDKPETHVIRKDDVMHYAFYDDNWDGEIHFKGLADKDYVVIDYINNKELGTVSGPVGSLKTSFKHALLVKVVPVSK